MSSTGIDLEKILENKRHDLVSLGYGFGRLNVKNEQIIVTHPNTANVKIEHTSNNLILTGHSHKSKNIYANANSHIFLPSLSEVPAHTISGIQKQFPGMIKVAFPYRNGYFNMCKFEHFLFINNKMYKVSETQADLIPGKKYQDTFVNNEEERKPLSKKEIDNILGVSNNSVIKKENTKTLRLSQIEKFRQRYNVEKK